MTTSQSEQPNQLISNESMKGINLLEGEEVLKNELPSWVNWWILLIPAAVIAIVGVIAFISGDFAGGLIILLIAGIPISYVRYARRQSRYIVTNQRVKKSVGLLRKSTGEVRIADIRGLSTEQGLLERLVGKGSVLIDSGAAAGKLGIQGVANPQDVAATIREQQRRIEATGN